MPITPLPTPPSRSDPDDFAERADDFLGALPAFATEASTLQVDVNAKAVAASTSQAAASTSATASASSATAAAGSAASAGSSASAASTSATASASSATAAAGSATAASASEAAALLAASGLFTYRGAWVTSTSYAVRDVVKQGTSFYVVPTGQAHTSGTFATDLAAGKWVIHQFVPSVELAASSGSSLIGWLRNATGAIATTLYKWLDQRAPVNVFDFMTDAEIADVQGGGAIDVVTKIQAAIDHCIANKRKLVMPAGYYRISTPLYVWKNSGADYFSLLMEGEVHSTSDTHNVRISPTFDDKPGIIIQGCRGVTIRNITITGQNNFESALGGNYNNLLAEPGIFLQGTCRDNRHSPHCCVAIDPFPISGSVVAGDQYPGLSAYYVAGKASSSHITFEHCNFRKAVVGVAMLAKGGSNTDITNFKDCDWEYNKVALALGHGQMKLTELSHCSIYGSMTAIDGVSYGDQNGCPPHIHCLNVGGTKFIFNVASGLSTPAISGIYAESFLSIGYFGGALAAGTTALPFTGCHFQFFFPDTARSPDIHIQAFKNLVFTGCVFAGSEPDLSLPLRIRKDGGIGLTFNGCTFAMQYVDSFSFSGVCGSTGGGQDADLTFNNCYIADGLNPSGRAVLTHHYKTTGGIGNWMIPHGALVMSGTSDSSVYRSGTLLKNVAIGSGITVSVAGRTSTFSAPSGIGALLRIGDQVWTSTGWDIRSPTGVISGLMAGPIGVISAISGDNITCIGTPENFDIGSPTGTHTLYVTYIPRLHAATTGDVANGSQDITNVTNRNQWRVGHRIYGTGIPSGAYVTVSTGTTLTISKAATASNTGVRLFDANISVITGTAL